jgi:cell division protein FtsL
MDAFYTIVVITFASLGVVTLFNHLVRTSETKATNAEILEDIEKEEARIASVQTEIKDLRFDSKILDEERLAIESQTQCLLKVEDTFTRYREHNEGRQ